MLNLTNLGMPATPHAYVPGLSLAPIPKHSTLRKPVVRNHQPATNAVSDTSRQLADADIRGMIGALAQLDHFARRLQDHCPMKYEMKRRLSLLINSADDMIGLVYKDFNSSEADDVNQWANLIGQAAGLILQLTPPQAEASMKHMQNMAASVLAYIPPTLPAECIERY
jgi:hypothetical protein